MVRPMLPTDGPLPTGSGWVAQPKLDGWRAIVTASRGTVRVVSRHGTALTGRYPALVAALAGRNVVLDGELVVYGEDGRPVFHEVGRHRPAGRLAFAAFDLLHLDGDDLTGLPLVERLARLADVGLPAPVEVVPSGWPADVWAFIEGHGLEGVVSKRLSSRYEQRRSAAWVRTKNWTTSTYRLAGWSTSGDRFGLLVALNREERAVAKVELGLPVGLRSTLDAVAGPLVVERRRSSVTVGGSVEVQVRHHGEPGRPRDAVFVGWASR